VNYYNEFDPKAAAWLRELIAQGQLPLGDVDERDIRDVRPEELDAYAQCHFFAGIGGWPLALRMAGWPEDRPVWTGSCPCQPFSNAGKRGGYDDERHLAPVWLDLVRQCRPASVFGEQVASAAGRDWLSDLRLEMEGMGYAVGAADLCAAGAGAPHIRQRLFFGAVLGSGSSLARADRAGAVKRLADGANTGQQRRRRPSKTGTRPGSSWLEPQRLCDAGRVDNSAGARHLGPVEVAEVDPRDETRLRVSGEAGEFGRVGDAERSRTPPRLPEQSERKERHSAVNDDGMRGLFLPGPWPAVSALERPHAPQDFWRAADWLHCTDGSWRPVEPGTFPLGHGLPARVGRLRGYGNAIVPQVGAIFIEEFDAAAQRVRLMSEMTHDMEIFG